ncbi:MAG: TIGR01906 family membrane protein [Clostridia bacterium]|nr:TIGR01906 family membrane protein [Clostridia bacterium]
MKGYAYAACAMMVVWSLLMALFSVGLNDEIYDAVQRRIGVNEITTGLDEQQRMTMNRQIAMYLAGRTNEIDNLSERAKIHMQDVKGLLSSARIALYASAGAMIVFGIIGMKRAKAHMKRAFFVCTGAYVLIAGLIAAASAVDFSGIFTLFHEMLFTNDLWLLNPNEDALIRILPEKFFIVMAVIIALAALAHCLFTGALIWGVNRLMGRLKKDELL